jgi:hypothetical protein
MSRTAIIVSFDRLPCAGLGCYGNEWIDTPGFDALAASGFVFDHHLAEELRGDAAGLPHRPRLDAGWLRDHGVDTALLHEPHSELVIDPAAFATVRDCGGEDGLDVAATDLPFARLVQRGTAWLTEPATADRLLWLSSAGLPDICRPPEGALDLYVEEFAQHEIDWDALSPEAFGRHPAIRAAYLSLIDHWLGQLRAAVGQLADPVLLIVVGCEGRLWQPVPRRQSVPGGLESQAIETPWLMWANDGSVMPGRSSALVQLSDLPPTVGEWMSPVLRPLTLTLSPEDGGEGTGEELQPSVWPLIRGERTTHRETAVTRGLDGAIGVRTATESMVFTAEAAEARAFLKPEDAWDVNDVAGSIPETVAQIVAAEKSSATVAAFGPLR